MQNLAGFFRRIYIFVLFVALEFVAFNFYSSGSLYTRGQYYKISNAVLGSTNARRSNISSYFNLNTLNDSLASQNAFLRARLMEMEEINARLLRGETMDTASLEVSGVDSLALGLVDSLAFYFTPQLVIVDEHIEEEKSMSAKVENNSINKRRNFITLSRGAVDGVKLNYPVVSGDAVVGYIVAVGEHYSVAVSMLNIDFKASGMLKRDDALCSVSWDGNRSDCLSFSGISRYSEIAVGDSIMTTGFSNFFTPNKVLGVVESFKQVDQMYYEGTMRPAVRFDCLRYVDIIFVDRRAEQEALEKQVIN